MSIYFAVFDKTTGFVLRTGLCGARDFVGQAIASNEEVVETDVHLDPNEYIVDLTTRIPQKK